MSRRPRLVVGVLIATLSLLFIVPAAAQTLTQEKASVVPPARAVNDTVNGTVGGVTSGAQGTVDGTVQGVAGHILDDTKQEQKKTLAYWTKERMRSATPALPSLLPGQQLLDPAAVPGVTQTAPKQNRNVGNGSSKPYTAGGAVVRTVGKVFFTLASRDFVCSATSVNSGNKDTLVTAGHCLNNGPGEYAKNWVFVPAYDGNSGAEPYGRWTARQLFAPAEFSQRGNLNFDFGYAVLNTNNGKHIADAVGTQSIAFNTARGQNVHSFGYPALAPFNGRTLYACQDQARQDTHGGTGQGIDCDMTEGSSGGPWFTSFNNGTGTVTSVNSFSYTDSPSVMYGPYLGDAAAALYRAASAV